MATARVFAFALMLTGIGACSLPTSVILPSGGMDAGLHDAGPDAPRPDTNVDSGTDAGHDGGMDAGIDADVDGGMDAGSDTGLDGGSDAGNDGGNDGGTDAWMPSPLGTACSTAVTCASGHCVDGVCCESACAGVCETCGGTGTCNAAPAASDPDDECAVQTPTSCGTTGFCNGMRACERYGNTTVCLAATCTAGVQTDARTCDGAGTCADRGTTTCAPFACNGNVCFGSCASTANCGPMQYCATASGTCLPRQPNGAICSASEQCTSGNCIDGVCCNTACVGDCQACSAALTGGASGTCGSITAGTDPDAECAMTPASTCGTNGSCNGAGACALYVAGTQCVVPSCASGTETRAASCNGAGVCATPTTAMCAPYTCGPASCQATCAGPSDCAVGFVCSGGACLLPQGAVCARNAQCSTGQCVDGVCCNTACTGLCQACTAALVGSGVDGTCGSITAGTDPDAECAMQSATTCGTTGMCNGGGACALYDATTVCVAQSCAAHVVTRQRRCDGAGTCVAASPATQDCSPYPCSGITCAMSCVTAADCLPGYGCTTGGVCSNTVGTPCMTGSQCGTGFCVDGFCCSGACTGTCQGCSSAITNNVDGICDDITNGTDPMNECFGGLNCFNGHC